nr:PREDICTED: MTSS1-like protein [Opisthocomus hoazin]
MSTSACPYGELVPSNVEELVLHGEEVSPAASDLAMVLTRGLSLEHQKSSRDSLQYSSGYSTQTTTPSCSEDTIPSQGTGPTAAGGTQGHPKWHPEGGRGRQKLLWSWGMSACTGCGSVGLQSRDAETVADGGVMAAEVAVGDQITTGTVALCCDRVGGACCEHVVAEFGCDPVGAVVVGVVVTVTVGSDDDCAVVTAEGHQPVPKPSRPLADVTDPNSIKAAVGKVREKVGSAGLNLLINNACTTRRSTVATETAENMTLVYTTNTIGPLQTSQAFLPLLKEAAKAKGQCEMSCSRAAIVNISSILGSIEAAEAWEERQDICYRCSKAALNMLTKCLALEYGGSGILCVSVDPGCVTPPLGQGMDSPSPGTPSHGYPF